MTTKSAELVTTEETMPVQAVSQSDSFLATIQQAASDSTVDMDKMERLYGMYKDIKANESRMAYNTAMAECQQEMGRIEKTHWNAQTKSYHAKVEDVIRAIKPVWTKHGFSLTFYEGDLMDNGWINAKCDVSHDGGDTRTFTCPVPTDDKGMQGTVNKTQIHGRRSAKTYAQRYMLGDIFSLEITVAGADDDGNAAGNKIEPITDAQALKIDALITDNDLNKESIMAFLKQKLGIEHIADIPADKHKSVIRKINATIEAKSK